MLSATMPMAGALGMLALGPLVVVLGLGSSGGSCFLMLFPGRSCMLCHMAWGLPALAPMVLALCLGPAGSSCFPMMFSGMLMVSVARVCLFECLV